MTQAIIGRSKECLGHFGRDAVLLPERGAGARPDMSRTTMLDQALQEKSVTQGCAGRLLTTRSVRRGMTSSKDTTNFKIASLLAKYWQSRLCGRSRDTGHRGGSVLHAQVGIQHMTSFEKW